MKEFEYISVPEALRSGSLPRHDQLNDLGRRGWELVAVSENVPGPRILFLKREAEPSPEPEGASIPITVTPKQRGKKPPE